MNVFDFHCHPVLKANFSSNDFEQHGWRNTKGSADGILASQSSLAMLADAGINLICVALHAPERAMTGNWLLFLAAAHLRGWDLDSERVRRMGIGELDYLFLLRQDLLMLKKDPAAIDFPTTVKQKYGKKKVKVLTSINQYKPEDKDTVHIVLNVEGSHSFFKFNNTHDEKSVNIAGSIEQFKTFINESGRIFSINLTHLSHNPFCNHAYGLKILKDPRFLPQGDGIGEAGLKLIEACEASSNKVLIDIKHMSVKARLQFYQLRKASGITTPIVATHIGLTGFPLEDISGRIITVSTGNSPKISYLRIFNNLTTGETVSFYPLSINLYDEDIIEILASDGLIGLSLDQRILGICDKKDPIDSEYISKHELDVFATEEDLARKTSDELLNAALPNINEIHKALLEQDYFYGNTSVVNHPHGKYFLYNLFHIIKIAEENQEQFSHLEDFNIWDKICIGSDFDGLIDPIDFCRNVLEFGNLKAYLINNLGDYAKHFDVDISSGISPEEITEKLLYRNGYNFLKKNFV